MHVERQLIKHSLKSKECIHALVMPTFRAQPVVRKQNQKNQRVSKPGRAGPAGVEHAGTLLTMHNEPAKTKNVAKTTFFLLARASGPSMNWYKKAKKTRTSKTLATTGGKRNKQKQKRHGPTHIVVQHLDQSGVN